VRILLASNSPYYPSLGGGNKSNRLLMEALASRGHSVLVASRTAKFGPAVLTELERELALSGVPCAVDGPALELSVGGAQLRVLCAEADVRGFFARQLEAFRPDVTLSSTDDPAHLMLEPALRHPTAKVVYLIRAIVALPFGPDAAMPSEPKSAVLRSVDGAVGVSEFVARYAREWGGMDAIHVPISLLAAGGWPLLGRFENRFVTLINPCAVKGISVFLSLADALPEIQFAAVPSWGTTDADLSELGRRPNVTILPAVEDIDEILAQTRVMLVPSLWAEARSRVILEAMSRGIPVLASDVGGLAEAKLGVDYLLPVRPVHRYLPAVDNLMVPVVETPEQDVGPWLATLSGLIDDRVKYEALARQSRAAALAYAEGLSAAPFEAYLHECLQRPPRRANISPPPPKGESHGRTLLSSEKQRLLALRMKARLAVERPAIAPQSWIPAHITAPQEIAEFATTRARAALGTSDVEVRWDGMWLCRVGQQWFPQNCDFSTGREPDWKALSRRALTYLRDAEDFWFFLYKPKPGDVIVDIGAGRGEDVFAFSRAVGPSGRVIAIEAHPGTYAMLDRFCELNRLTNVTARHCACVDRRTPIAMETMAVWESNFIVPGTESASGSIPGIPFDELCDELSLDRIDFLKMNIEGAERVALAGCRRALVRSRFVCVAAHDFRADRGEGEQFRTRSLVRNFLNEAGFDLITREKDPRYYVPYHVHGFRPGVQIHAADR
jgi:FkbM family methyltransferase